MYELVEDNLIPIVDSALYICSSVHCLFIAVHCLIFVRDEGFN